MPDSFEAVVVASDGDPVAGAVVRIRPQHWTANSGAAPTAWETRTGTEGRFEIAWPDSGRWSLEILSLSREEGRFLPSVGDSLLQIAVPRMVLAPLASLSGRIPSPSVDTPGVVLLEGTDREVLPESTGTWNIFDLGPGTYRVLWSKSGRDSVLRDQVILGPADSLRLDSSSLAESPLVLAGRLAPVVGWEASPLPISGWNVSIAGDTISATTDANGEFRLPTTLRGAARIVANHPSSGEQIAWDTVVAASATGILRLVPRAARRRLDSATYAFVAIANPDRIRRPLRVRVAADTTALRSTGTPEPDRAKLPAMLGWTDDSGRFALRREVAQAYHATLVDSIDVIGAVFPWGDGTTPESIEPIHVGSPGRATVTVRLPPGTPSQVTIGGLLLSSMGTPMLAQAVLAGNPTTFSALYPGSHRFAVVSLQTAQPIAGWVDASISEASNTVVDTLLTQEQVEDSALWPHAVSVFVSGASLSAPLRNVPVRVDLDALVDFASFPPSYLGDDVRVHDESGRWVPAVATRWNPDSKLARLAILLDTLGPSGRSFTIRYGRPIAHSSGYAFTRFVFTRSGGHLSSFRGGTTDRTLARRTLLSENMAYGPGTESTQNFVFDPSTRARVAFPADTLGSVFAVQMVFTPEAAPAALESFLGIRDLSDSSLVASVGTRVGRAVLRLPDPDSGTREISLEGMTVARNARCVLQLRRLGDSLEVAIVSASSTTRRRFALSWPVLTDSVEVFAGAPSGNAEGFAGTVDALDVFDSAWSEARAAFDAAYWRTGGHEVRITPLR